MAIKKKGEAKPPEPKETEEQTDIEDAIDETSQAETPEQDEAPAGKGHNGGPAMTEEDGHTSGDTAKADDQIKTRLVDFAKAIEGIREDKKVLAEQEKDVFKEAKAVGFDVKALRAALAARKVDREERREAEDMRDFYLEILEERM